MFGALIIGGMVVALGVGVYVGLGMPGMPGREDRIFPPGRARRLKKQHIDYLKWKR